MDNFAYISKFACLQILLIVCKKYFAKRIHMIKTSKKDPVVWYGILCSLHTYKNV